MKKGVILAIGFLLSINLIFFVSAESTSSVLNKMLSDPNGVSIVYGDNAAYQDYLASTFISTSLDLNKIIPIYKASEMNNYKDKNLILVGGPCANQISADVTSGLNGYDCSGWKFDAGQSLIKVFNNGKGKIILVSGTTWQDTLKLAGIFQNHNSSTTLDSSDEILISTPLSNYTCGNGICEPGESTSTCSADCFSAGSAVANLPLQPSMVKISGDVAAFTGVPNSSTTQQYLYVLNFSSMKVKQVARAYSIFAVQGNNVAFAQKGAISSEYYTQLYNLSVYNEGSGTFTEISNPENNTLDVEKGILIYGNKVIYAEKDYADKDSTGALTVPPSVWEYDLSTGKSKKLFDALPYTELSGIYEDKIVYSAPAYCNPSSCLPITSGDPGNSTVWPPQEDIR